jgi:hypothetical protein
MEAYPTGGGDLASDFKIPAASLPAPHAPHAIQSFREAAFVSKAAAWADSWVEEAYGHHEEHQDGTRHPPISPNLAKMAQLLVRDLAAKML